MTPFTDMTKRLNDLREEETMHLFYADAREEKALCGADTSADCRRSVGGYLEDRLNESCGRHRLRGVQETCCAVRREPGPRP